MADLVNRVMPLAEPIGQAAGTTLYRWQDPSGARLLLGIDGDDGVTEMLPSFDAAVGARLGSVEFVSDEVASAAVLDEDGEQVTAFTVELEERLLLRAASTPLDGPAAITALGVDIEVFESADAFSESEASMLSPDDTDSEAPPHYAERGWKWPPRVAPEFFVSYGAFAAPEEANAHARLAGTVLHASLRRVELTGQSFVEARVRTAGFEAHVCFPADEAGGAVPSPGNVVHGTVFLVGSMAVPVEPEPEPEPEDPEPEPRRRRGLFRR